MGVMGKANAGGGQIGNGEPFLSKDELIRYKTPLAITHIEYDRWGSRQFRNPRWVCVVSAWDEITHPIPESAYPADADVDQPGIITFGDSEVRKSQFGTGRDEQGNAIGLSAQLEDAKTQGVDWIGPVAVISSRAANGTPFKTLADVQLTDDGTVVVDARGFAVLEGAAEEAPTTNRRRAPAAQAPAAAAAPPAPTAVRQARRSTGQRARAAAAAAPTAPQVPAPAAAEAPSAPPRVGRRATAPVAAPAAPTAPAPAPAAATPRRRAAGAQQAQTSTAASPEAYERQSQQQAQREAAGPPAIDPRVRERTESVEVGTASATCPFCQIEIEGRLYPSNPEAFARFYAESARAFGWPELTDEQRAAGGQVIAHPNCPMLQQTVMLPYVMFTEEEAS